MMEHQMLGISDTMQTEAPTSSMKDSRQKTSHLTPTSLYINFQGEGKQGIEEQIK
jgi:hypothetical protein